MTDRNEKCETRIKGHLDSRIEDLTTLWGAYTNAGSECPECGGTGEVAEDCPECDGVCQTPTGVAADWEDCPTCDGDGETWAECSNCDGSGNLDEEGNVPDLGNMYEYGLCFDYVAPDTFRDQDRGYFRYQLSWGGPSDEFRVYADKVDDYNFYTCSIEYAFMDWFDGASRTLHGSDRDLLAEIFDSFFVDSGTAEHKYNEAMDD